MGKRGGAGEEAQKKAGQKRRSEKLAREEVRNCGVVAVGDGKGLGKGDWERRT